MAVGFDLYLASKSPRRRELLQQIGVRFKTVETDVIEIRQDGEAPEAYVQRLAFTKAQTVANSYTDLPVLGADTTVVLGEQVLEKPSSEEQAVQMLLALSGKTHQVMTAVSLYFEGRHECVLSTTTVGFRPITLSEANQYWATGEPIDKAGAYGIQGKGAVFIEHINGSYSSVVGLPLLETSRLLETFEVPIWQV